MEASFKHNQNLYRIMCPKPIRIMKFYLLFRSQPEVFFSPSFCIMCVAYRCALCLCMHIYVYIIYVLFGISYSNSASYELTNGTTYVMRMKRTNISWANCVLKNYSVITTTFYISISWCNSFEWIWINDEEDILLVASFELLDLFLLIFEAWSKFLLERSM